MDILETPWPSLILIPAIFFMLWKLSRDKKSSKNKKKK